MSDAIGLNRWKELARGAGDAEVGDADARVRSTHKTLTVGQVKTVDGPGRKLAFIISSGSVDRDNDILNPKGWTWDSWLSAGAPVLYGHNPANPPIAFGDGAPTLVEGTKLRCVADFGESGEYPLADLVYSLARPREGRKGGLRAASVGFLPIEWTYNEKRGGYDFNKQEGLEWSIVAIPSNRDAVLAAKELATEDGIDATKTLRRYAEELLDATGDEPGLWVPKAQALEVFKAIREPRVTVPDRAVIEKAADVVLAVAKRGRVLSSANEERLRAARAHGDNATGAMSDLCAALDDVLAQLPTMDPEPDPQDPMECAAPEKAAEPDQPFVLIIPEPREQTFSVDPDKLAASVTAAVSEVVAAEVRRARGRLD